MDYNETWGIEYSRAAAFFDGQTDVLCEAEGRYRYGEAEITLTRLPDKQLGSLHFARTELAIRGGADADEVHRRFYLRFLSAGG